MFIWPEKQYKTLVRSMLKDDFQEKVNLCLSYRYKRECTLKILFYLYEMGESGRCSNWRMGKNQRNKNLYGVKECWNMDKTSFSTEQKYSVKITPGQRIICISTGYLQTYRELQDSSETVNRARIWLSTWEMWEECKVLHWIHFSSTYNFLINNYKLRLI